MKKTSDASILVTDSGLGGLSVFNRVAASLLHRKQKKWSGRRSCIMNRTIRCSVLRNITGQKHEKQQST